MKILFSKSARHEEKISFELEQIFNSFSLLMENWCCYM
jgi:hypothetical protein